VKFAEVVRLVVAILLVPLCVAAAVVLGRDLAYFTLQRRGMSAGGFAIFLGGLAYVVVFVFLDETVLALPFARGNVQRFWGTFIGYRGPRSPGAAEHDDPDSAPPFRPLLAVPYMVPIYTVIAIPVIYLVSWAFDIYDRHWLRSLQGFLLGATFTFHVFLVGNDIRRKHKDLRAVGYLLTLVLVIVVCVQVLAAALMTVFPGASWVEFNRSVLNEIQYAYEWSWELVSGPFR
jgi:hypothetical protein